MVHALRICFSFLIIALSLSAIGCQGAATPGSDPARQGEAAALALPTLNASEAADDPLRVVATTSLIGDAAARVGGQAISLKTLMAPGQDPHSYEPTTADLTGVTEADVILLNGWKLEERLVTDLANVAAETPLVAVSAGITPLLLGAPDEDGHADGAHDHAGADPHVWLDPQNMQQWVENIATVFSALDPANAAQYTANAAAYLAELEALDEELEAALSEIPPQRRRLVTNHDALAYFARRFDFEITGTVIPAASTLAEPSAQALAALVETMRAQDVCTIFAETTANTRLAEAVAAELQGCDRVQVLPLYTGALGPPGSSAETYVEMMRANVEMVVRGLGGD